MTMCCVFFFNDPATTEISPLPLPHALPILTQMLLATVPPPAYDPGHPLQALVTNLDASPYVGRLALLRVLHGTIRKGDRKSTRLNSSHSQISYAVFCLKK